MFVKRVNRLHIVTKNHFDIGWLKIQMTENGLEQRSQFLERL